MGTKLAAFWYELRSSYWFVPSLMTVAAIGVAFFMLSVDRTLEQPQLRALIWIYGGGAEGARTLLSTVAGSMITVAGVVFSITIVALSLTASQFGPRLLVNFMRDPGNQIVLGVFLATYAYCLIVLRAVRGNDPGFVPHVAVTLGIALAAASVGVLIFFIHHVSTSIQAENVIAAVRRDLDATIERFLAGGAEPEDPADDGIESARTHVVNEGTRIRARKSGYVQGIDYQDLTRLAARENLVIALGRRAGTFAVEGDAVAWAAPAERLTEQARNRVVEAFVIGSQRTPTQDIEFAISQLVEVAMRALSPGINDPHTAMTCVDWLGSALCRLTERDLPSAARRDADGRLRLVLDPVTYEGLVDAAFNQIRQHGRGNVAVSIRLLESLATIARFVHREDQRAVLLRHARMIERSASDTVPEDVDRAAIVERIGAVTAALDRTTGA